MIGIVYKKDTKEIILIVPDVQSTTNVDIIGRDASAKGIDLAEASFCIVDSSELQVGDILGTFTDVRASLPPSLEEQMKQMQEVINILMMG